MGRKTALAHDFWWTLRRLLPLAALGLCVFAVLMPVSTAGIPRTSVFNVSFTHDQLKFRFFAEQLALVVDLAVAGYGLSLGLVQFRFTLVKQQTATFFSLGLSRTSLFLTRFVGGLVALIVGVLVPLGVSLLLNCLALGVTPGVFSQCAYIALGLAVLALVGMTVGAIACFITGTGREAAGFGAALLAAVSVVTWGLNALMDHLLVGNAFGELTYSRTTTVAAPLLKATAPFNPLLFFADASRQHSLFWRSGTVAEPPAVRWLLPVGWLIAVVVLVGVALACLQRRRTENAGIAGSAPWAEFFTTAIFSIAAFAVAFHFLAPASAAVAVAGGVVVAGVLGWVLPRGLGHMVSSRKRMLTVAVAPMAIAGIMLAVVATGGLGYSDRIPAVARVAAVDVSYVGTPSYLATQAATFSTGRSYYFSTLYSYEDAAAIDLVVNTQRKLIEHARSRLAVSDTEFSDTVVPYDIIISYHLTDGHRLTRYYDRASLADLGELLALDDTPGVVERQQAVIAGNTAGQGEDGAAPPVSAAAAAFRDGQIYLADVWYSNPVRIDLSKERRQELLRAVADDVAEQPSSARYFPPGPALGVLMFSQNGEKDTASFGYSLENTLVYVTSGMTETIVFLKENALSDYMTFPGKIESLSFQKFSPYSSMNKVTQPASCYFLGYRSDYADDFWTQQDFGLHMKVDDPAKVAAIVPKLRSSYFMSDGGYLVAAKLVGMGSYVYCYLPAGDAPLYVRKGAL